MQIILLRSRSNAMTLTHWHLALAAAAFAVSVMAASCLLYYVTFRNATNLDIPILRDILASAAQHDVNRFFGRS